MERPLSIIRHRSVFTLALTVLAASDLAYRLLVREPVRRALGMVPGRRV